MTLNLELRQIELIKIYPEYPKITCLSYGTYDNGYALLGFDDGTLHSLDFITFDIFDKKRVFENKAAVTSIGFEPTRLIFVGSSEGQLLATSFL